MTQTKRMTWSSGLGVGSGAENPHPVKLGFVSKPHLKPRKVGWRKKVGGGHGPKTGRSAIEEEEGKIMTYVLLNRQIHTTIWYYYVISVYHNLYIQCSTCFEFIELIIRNSV
jgi:hypothetical protein